MSTGLLFDFPLDYCCEKPTCAACEGVAKCVPGVFRGRTGRKSWNVPVANVCKALRDTKSKSGEPCYAGAARKLAEELGHPVSAGFIHKWVTRQAANIGCRREKLLNDILKGRYGKHNRVGSGVAGANQS